MYQWKWLQKLTFLLIITGCHSDTSELTGPKHFANDTIRIAEADPQFWLTHGGNYEEQRFSALNKINKENITELSLAWYFDFDTHRGQESTPLMVDGIIYVTSAWSKVFALSAETGEEIWKFDPQVPGKAAANACCDAVNRGAAYYAGKIFIGTLDGRLIALDAHSGKVVWSVITVDQSKPYTITGAPRAAKGKVFIGNGGAEFGVRGYVSAYDTESGNLAWRFYTVPGDPNNGPDGAASDEVLEEKARPTWHGRAFLDYGGGGGTVWDTIVYDPELDQLYIGTGNGSPWNRQFRSEDKGDNLFLSSIVALNPDNGAYLWHYQETPGETWDYTATQQITLATITIDGLVRKTLIHAPKNGFFYVIDRQSGELISAEKFFPANWASHIDKETGRPVETEGARFRKAPFISTIGGGGAHSWQPMSYSPITGLVYIPTQQLPFVYEKDRRFKYRPGEWNTGVNLFGGLLPQDPAERAAIAEGMGGDLLAWDPINQEPRWRVSHGQPWNGGTLATAGGLVFQGLANRTFRAYDAYNGDLLWQYATQDAIITAPITFSLDEEQYIAVTVGNGGGVPLTLPTFSNIPATPNGRLLAFKLNGTASLPKVTAQKKPPIRIANFLNNEQRAEGFRLYTENCSRCHAVEILTSGVLPDLRRSDFLSDPQLWYSVVSEGALEDKGMIGFRDKLAAEQVEMIRGYVVHEANILAEQR